MNQKKVGKFISQCRKEKGMTQAQVAERFGVSNVAVSKWENGKSLPDASIMIELCDLLGITVNELLSGEKINMEEYKEKAESNLISAQNEKNVLKKRTRLLKIGLISVIVLCLIIGFLMFCSMGRAGGEIGFTAVIEKVTTDPNMAYAQVTDQHTSFLSKKLPEHIYFYTYELDENLEIGDVINGCYLDGTISDSTVRVVSVTIIDEN